MPLFRSISTTTEKINSLSKSSIRIEHFVIFFSPSKLYVLFQV